MKKFKSVLGLLRVKHYLKNTLIFAPLFFSKQISSYGGVKRCAVAFLAFSVASSFIYILNDIKDVEKDRLHPQKKNRPIASGVISKRFAYCLMSLCLLITLIFAYSLASMMCTLILIIYIALNIGYSMGLKNVPILDVTILVSGYILRIEMGSACTDIIISEWLFLLVISATAFMGIGKRRNEMRDNSVSVRKVLECYNYDFLDKTMYVFMALTYVFYSLWAASNDNRCMLWTVPIIIIIIGRYCLILEVRKAGDPVEIFLSDKQLIILSFLYVIVISFLLYF